MSRYYHAAVSFLVLAPLLCLTRLCAAQDLQITLAADTTRLPSYNYTLRNVEPANSGNQIDSFYLNLAAPITNVRTPQYWQATTDFRTYIIWVNNDDPPFPHDIAPLASLGGFGFDSVGVPTSQNYLVTSYDHVNNQGGTDVSGQVVSPFFSGTAVPEPGAVALMAGMGAMGCCLLRRRK